MGVQSNAFDFQFGFQASKGTPAANPTYYCRALAGSTLESTRAWSKVMTGEGKRVPDGMAFANQVTVAGSLKVAAQEKTLAAFLYGALGTDNVTGAGDPYAHAMTINQTGSLPYITIWKHIGTKYEVYSDCKIDKLTVTVSATGDTRMVTIQADIKGIGIPLSKTSGPGTPATDEGSTAYLWDYGTGAWKIDTVTTANISEMILTITNAVDAVPGESIVAYAAVEKVGEVQISSKQWAEDLTRYNTIKYGVSSPIDGAALSTVVPTGAFECTLTKVAASPGPERSVKISVPSTRYTVADPPLNPDPTGAPIYYTIAGYAIGADPKITATVKCGLATL